MNKQGLKLKLKSVFFLSRQIEEYQEQIERLRSIAEKVTPAYSLVPAGGSGEDNRVKAILKIVELEDKFSKDVISYTNAVNETNKLIHLLPVGIYRTILIKRYLNHQGWHKIGEDLAYEQSWIFTLHGKALNELLKIINSKEEKERSKK